MTWQPQWPAVRGAGPAPGTAARLADAAKLEVAADTRARLQSAIAAYEALAAGDPLCYRAHVGVAQLSLLQGDAYEESVAGKRRCFMKAMRHSESAMFCNEKFREKIHAGAATWEACSVLGTNEMDAMFFWVNAVFYVFKEGQSVAGQVFNFRWIGRARQVMEHMTALDPDWGRGALHLTWGLYFLSVPESMGGDRKKSADFLGKAVAAGPEDLVHRWARAKYYSIKMRDRQRFSEDLEWVLSRDPSRSPGSPAWNSFFARDARRLLDNAGRYFPD